MAKKLPEDQKLRRVIRRAVESRRNFLDKPERMDYRQKVCVFLEKFILCEVGIKKALGSYYKNHGEEKAVEDINMPMDHITNALTEAGFDISGIDLNKMFRKNNKRGERSARDLRNSIVHDMSVNDIHELVDRWDEIEAMLDDFLAMLVREPLD